jgi:hypothetical protein
MKIHRKDVDGQEVRAVYCAQSSTVGDMGGRSISHTPTAVLLGNGIGIDLDAHEEPLTWDGWPSSLKRDSKTESLFSSVIGKKVTGLRLSDDYPNLVILLEGGIVLGMGSPAPWCSMPVMEHMEANRLSLLGDFFNKEN